MQPLNHSPAVAVRRTERGDHPDGAWDSFIGAFDIADPLLTALNTMANVAAGQQAWFADPFPAFNPQGSKWLPKAVDSTETTKVSPIRMNKRISVGRNHCALNSSKRINMDFFPGLARAEARIHFEDPHRVR